MANEEQDPKAKEPEDENSEDDIVERCSCGHDRKHHMVSAVPTYTTWGQFWVILMGVSASPIRLDFKCRICKERFDFTTSSKELEQFL